MPLPRKTVPRPRSFNCTQCGGPISLRLPERAMSVVCPKCGSILDTSTPTVALLHAYQKNVTESPRIPLGTRATFRGVKSEVVGYMRRRGHADGESFTWTEYLLYNPYYGYRFLSETVVGWTFADLTTAVPQAPAHYTNGVLIGRDHYAVSESYDAEVLFVLGEFYWQVAVGERTACSEFKSGSRLLVGETTDDEYTWAAGRYVSATEVWKAFGLPDSPPDYESEAGDPEVASSPVAVFIVIALVLLALWVIFMMDDENGSFFGGK